MNNPYRGGTADWWYSGYVRDLWIEYKYVQKLPKSVPIVLNLSALQKLWLRDRYKEGRNIMVILGHPNGGVILQDLNWEEPLTTEQVLANTLDRKALANFIFNFTEKSR
jgi:hypothetical protein